MMMNLIPCYYYTGNFHITLSPKICRKEDNENDEVTETVRMCCFCLLLKIEHYTVKYFCGKNKNRE